MRTFHHDVWGHDFPQAYDGASPGSALLSSGFVSSGQTLFTPGLAQQDGNGQHFYQTDALGSVRGVSGNNQAPQGEVYYDAFGLPSVRQGSMPWPLGFAAAAGYQTDTDTGLMLLGNRYYDPSIGRFLSPDKVHDGNNWYAYCGNNPLAATDPTGNEAQTINGSGVGSAMFVSMTMGAGPAMDYMAGIDAMFDDLQHNAQVYANKPVSGQSSVTTPAGQEQLDEMAVESGGEPSGVGKPGKIDVGRAASKIENTLKQDVERHISDAKFQRSDPEGHAQYFTKLKGRDYDHIRDLRQILSGLRNNTRLLIRSGNRNFNSIIIRGQVAIHRILTEFGE